MNENNENTPEATESTNECCGDNAATECTEEATADAGDCPTEATTEECCGADSAEECTAEATTDAGDCSAEASDDCASDNASSDDSA